MRKILFLALLVLFLMGQSVVLGTAIKDEPQSQHRLPILNVTPEDNASGIRPDAPIQITLDPNAPTYKRFKEQFEKGFVEVTLNGQVVEGTYDEKEKKLDVDHFLLDRYSNNTVCLTTKADMHSGKNASYNASYCYSFKTGSALNEATQLSVTLEKEQVPVTETALLFVKVTDDYGLPATNATVKVQSDSPNLIAPELILDADDNGEGVIELTDHVRELVSLTVIAQDNAYPNIIDKENANIEFLAGPPDYMTVVIDSPVTSQGNTLPILPADGQTSAQVTITVFDKYGNRVPNAVISLESISNAQFPSSITTNDNGQATFIITNSTSEDIEITLTALNGVTYIIKIKCLNVISSHDIVTWEATQQADGSVVITGQVIDLHGSAVTNAIVPVETGEGTIYPITDESGKFTFVFYPTEQNNIVSISIADNNPKIYFGSSASEKEIDVAAGQIIRILGSDDIEAQINGTTILIQSDGRFGVGSSGRLKISNGSGEGYIIYIEDECECDHHEPMLELKVDPDALTADGKSIATITGRVLQVTKDFMGQPIIVPVVNGEVILTITDSSGTPKNIIAKTDSNGNFKEEYTVTSTSGIVQITATHRNVSQSTTINVSYATSETLKNKARHVLLISEDNKETNVSVLFWLDHFKKNIINWSNYHYRGFMNTYEGYKDIYGDKADDKFVDYLVKTYDRIIINNLENVSNYAELKNNMHIFEEYTRKGGILIFLGSNRVWSEGPFDITNTKVVSKSNYIIDNESPFTKNVQNPFYARNIELTNLPENSNILMSADEEGKKPTVIEFNIENGYVFVTTHSMSSYYDPNTLGKVFENMINYLILGKYYE